MFPIIQIGPMALQTPGLILLIGLWLGLVLAERLASRFQANPNDVYNMVFVAMITGVIGARISLCVAESRSVFAKPTEYFFIEPWIA